jgi:hypothetical protein
MVFPGMKTRFTPSLSHAKQPINKPIPNDWYFIHLKTSGFSTIKYHISCYQFDIIWALQNYVHNITTSQAKVFSQKDNNPEDYGLFDGKCFLN